jgi:hypothetical protein
MIKNFTIIESFTHFIPTGLGWIEGLDQLGHNTYAIPTSQYDYSDMSLDDMDWVVFMGVPNLEKFYKFKHLNPNVKIIIVCFGWDNIYLDLKNYVDVWVEHTYKHDLIDAKFKEYGMKLHHIPLGASNRVFTSLEIEKIYDLSFANEREWCWVVTDYDRMGHYPSKMFKSLDEVRNEHLDLILG